jgi:hypothetical protein
MGKGKKDDDSGQFSLWVESVGTASGGYTCAIKADERLLRILSPADANAYAAEVEWATVCAEHDAAVIKQLTAAEMDLKVVAQTISQLRAGRRPIRHDRTAPLRLASIVSSRDHVGRVTGDLAGVTFQWELDEARQHARYVRECSLVADLDLSYRTFLRGQVGLEAEQAQAYVSLLRNFTPSS